VENVYVTGAGLWPAGGSWNPTMTMVALAQDLADQLAAAPALAPKPPSQPTASADLGIQHYAATQAEREPDKEPA
jgi:choline dehydrogenase-like flavoprotein